MPRVGARQVTGELVDASPVAFQGSLPASRRAEIAGRDMAVLTPVHDEPRPRSSRHLLVALLAVIVVAAMAAVLVVSVTRTTRRSSSVARGSGRATTESRRTAPFTKIELAGANTMTVRVGVPQSIAVSGDDNLVDRVTTNVRDGSLVVANRGSFTTKAPMRVAIAVSSLDAVTISGAGTITVEDVSGPDLAATLSGTGTLRVSGSVDRVTAVHGGSGTVDLGDLVAHDVVARLDGTGTIRLHATSTLDATLTGTGSIVYSGHPRVTTRHTGTGTITSNELHVEPTTFTTRPSRLSAGRR